MIIIFAGYYCRTVQFRTFFRCKGKNKKTAAETTMGKAAVAHGDVPEYFVQCLSHIENMGTVSRHVLVTTRTVGGKVIYVPAVHIIMPNSAVADGIMKATKALAISMKGLAEPAFN